jgi:Down syndrome cell adhesion molecule-like protein 1
LLSTVRFSISFEFNIHRSAICFPLVDESLHESLLFLQVLPVIAPFTFGEDELNLDDSVMASCSITKGDSPIHIWWKFSPDGSDLSHNLTTNDGIVISRNSQKFSILAIEAVKARHRGNYSCFASNKAGVAQFSSYLAING